MLVVVTALAVILGYQANWIRQRVQLRHWENRGRVGFGVRHQNADVSTAIR